MPTTTLKLPPALKRRVASVVRGTDKSAHGFMVEAIAKEAERAELHRKFVDEALAADQEVNRTGVAYDAKDVHAYLTAIARGKPARRPKAKRWRK